MNTTAQEINTEKMGVQLSQSLKWDGFAILEVAKAALEDSNFHKESKVIADMLEKLNTDLENGTR